MEKPIRVKTEGRIALITLNRPDSYNSFNKELLLLLRDTMATVSSGPEVDGVVITGSGRAFCAGGDLKWIDAQGKEYAPTFYELAGYFHQAVTEIRRMPKPVIAAVNGLAAGGGMSLALACDLRVMDMSAVFLQAYTSRGLSIDGGGTFSLPRLVGLAKAMEIIAFDQPINPEQALSWGLVTEVTDKGHSVKRAIELIAEIKKGRAFISFAASKRLIYESFNTSFDMQLEKEKELLSWCSEEPEGREGIAAFVEKRIPVFDREKNSSHVRLKSVMNKIDNLS